MKKSSTITACMGICLLASSTMAATININPGDNVVSKFESAGNGDTIVIAAGVYKNVDDMVTRANNLTVVGAPFEASGEPSDIDKVVIQFKKISDNWITLGKTTVRGIRFEKGDHQIVAEDEILVEHCQFDEGADQVSFNKTGYGTVRYCEFYRSGDDGIDMDSNANVDGAYFNIHNNLFEATREDGIEFRTYGRKRYNTTMPVEFHHNTFYNCGTDTIDEGGDALQIIDQEEDGAASREIMVYNNIFNGANQTWNGVACNVKNSDAQHGSVGGPKLNEPIWVWNNTFYDLRGVAVAGGNKTWAFNNIVIDCRDGSFVRCEAENNISHNSDPIIGTAATDKGDNISADPKLNLATFVPNDGSPAVGAGLLIYTAGGMTVTPEHSDIGALEGKDGGGGEDTAPKFGGNLLVKATGQVGVPYNDSIAGDASDVDGDALSFSKLSGPAWLDVAADGALTGTPDAEGTSTFTVQVEANGLTDNATLEIEVAGAVLEPGVAVVGADMEVTADPSGTVSVTLDGSASTGDIVSYTWKANGNVITAGMAVDHDFTPGSYVITLEVLDLEDNTSSASFNLVVNEADTGGGDLSVNAGPDMTVETPSGSKASVTLSAVGSGDIIDYVWKKDNVRLGVGQTITVDLDIGEHTIIVRVKDAADNVARDIVVVTVDELIIVDPDNSDPYFGSKTILSTRARTGRELEKDISNKGKDRDGDTLSWSIDGPAWLSISSDGVLSGTPGEGDKGRNTFTVTATDGRGGSASALVKIRVR